MKNYPCGRCGGKGVLPHHANVLGGVCFKCGGSGQQKSKPSTPLPKWDVFAKERASGNEISVFTLRAKTADKALKTARVKLASAPGYFADSVRVEPA